MPVVQLIRHAEPVLTGVVLGRTDPPLARLPNAAEAEPEGPVYASPLLRARQTAEGLFPGWALEIRSGLAERDMGEWDGLTWMEIESRWPEQARAALENWQGFTPPGGESWPAFQERVRCVWEELRANAPCTVVAHLGVNAVLRECAGGGEALRFQQSYGEVVRIAV